MVLVRECDAVTRRGGQCWTGGARLAVRASKHRDPIAMVGDVRTEFRTDRDHVVIDIYQNRDFPLPVRQVYPTCLLTYDNAAYCLTTADINADVFPCLPTGRQFRLPLPCSRAAKTSRPASHDAEPASSSILNRQSYATVATPARFATVPRPGRGAIGTRPADALRYALGSCSSAPSGR